jgi:purine catabolism regulator
MDYTLWEFLQSDIAAKAHQFAGSRELRHIPIESVSVQELPVDDFIQKDELVLSTAVGCLHDAAAFLTLVRSVKDAGAAALFLAFRDTGYVIPPEVIKFADSLGLPLFSIPWERHFSDIQTAVNSAVRKKKLSVYQDLQAALFNAYFDVKPIDHAVSMISKTLHVPTVIMDANHRILAQADSIPENDPSHTFHELEICTGGMLAGYLRFCTEASPPMLPALPESPAELLQKYVCFPLSLWFNRKSIEDLTTLRLKNDFVWIRYNNFRKLKSKQKKTWFAVLW